MALREMRRLAGELGREHGCLHIRVVHRLGRVPVGATALYVGVASRHRQEGLAFLAAFIDRLKQEVPIWKRLPAA
jgi:molybdopterin synthase catalytic subunit